MVDNSVYAVLLFFMLLWIYGAWILWTRQQFFWSYVAFAVISFGMFWGARALWWKFAYHVRRLLQTQIAARQTAAHIGSFGGTRMSSDNAGAAFGLVVLAAIVAVPAYNGVFYTTGRQWYEKCYEYYDAERELQSKGGWGEPKTSDPYKAAFWATCGEQSKRGIYGAGLVFTWENPELTKFCPSMYSDVPIGGTYLVTLKLIKANGGLRLEDNFIPASWMIGNLYSNAWPQCVTERIKAGYPAIVEISTGRFGWAHPCEKCESTLLAAK